MKVSTILDHIDSGHMALPEFQRGYVWNRDQVRGLYDSMYKRHPIGGLLVWATESKSATHRGDGPLAPGVVKLPTFGNPTESQTMRATGTHGDAEAGRSKSVSSESAGMGYSLASIGKDRESTELAQPMELAGIGGENPQLASLGKSRGTRIRT